ncbi:Flp pilus assembly protein CpaB [Desulfofundulus thermobenzoicus]|uniref:Flp pilus assembly protein CpaB n=1 Tax=Desulfofundulus thermobenzoicus TaxID=29376 RepID=A0A6N7IRI3_9FIRM|nr:Flp pilus assembly protein CpaB [Desulfofundulus thermobenzoicus]MQL52735.1 Flp pilus assembly protein CpaB [Desulfofundulus thermobenzoicus]HHW44750.1 Flp pilus assembly protein CpaB [Desulfotomaculum sp.]
MLKNYRLMLVVGLICGILAAAGAIITVNQKIGALPAVVAARDIDQQRLLAPEDLKVVPVPRAALYKDAIPAADRLVGWVSRGFIPAGTVLRQGMLLPPDQAGVSGILAAKYPDRLAVAVKADVETNVAGTVRPGDLVRVVARYKSGQGKEGRQETIADNIPVLAVNDKGVVIGLTAPENEKYNKAMADGAVVACAVLKK